MTELKYGLKAERLIKQTIEGLKTKGLYFQDYKLVTDYLRYHNDICPRCKKKMKVYNGEVKNAGSVVLSILTEKKVYAPHILCKPCSNGLEKEPEFIRRKKAEEVEDYIGSIVNELNPE